MPSVPAKLPRHRHLLRDVSARLPLLVLAVLIAATGCPAFAWLIRRWWDGQYLAGLVATVAVAAWCWQHRGHVVAGRVSAGGELAGVALVLMGGAAALAAQVIESSVLLGWATLLALGGLVWQWRSTRAAAAVLAPILAYSFLIFPPPGIVAQSLSLPIRLCAARVSALLVQGVGVDCVVIGTTLQTSRWTNTIVPACGGEEVVHLFLVVGIALAYVQHRRLRPLFWVQVAAIAPATLLANAVRIAVLTLLGHFWGPAASGEFFHEFSGVLVFTVFLVSMIALGELLQPRPGAAATPAPITAPAGPAAAQSGSPGPEPRRRRRRTLLWGLQAVACAAALMYGVWEGHLRRSTVWGAHVQQMIPDTLPGWQRLDLSLTPAEQSYLARNQVVKRLYFRGPAKVVVFASTGAEGRRQAYHSPEICYVADGWRIVERREGLTAAGRRPLHYNLLRAAREGEGAVTVIYWLDDGLTRSGDLAVKTLGEILRRLRHPFQAHDEWTIISITSPNPDGDRALAECLELAGLLP